MYQSNKINSERRYGKLPGILFHHYSILYKLCVVDMNIQGCKKNPIEKDTIVYQITLLSFSKEIVFFSLEGMVHEKSYYLYVRIYE